MLKSDVEKYRPCGRYERCKASPGCGDCKEWDAFLRLLAIDNIEENLSLGISLEMQKKEAQQVIQPDTEEEYATFVR